METLEEEPVDASGGDEDVAMGEFDCSYHIYCTHIWPKSVRGP